MDEYREHDKRFLYYIAVIVIVGGLCLYLGMKINSGEPKGAVNEVQTVSEVTLKEVLRSASDLVSQKYYYTDLDKYENHKEILGKTLPFTSEEIIFSYDGVISAGIDVSEVEFKIDNEKKVITVYVPKSRILTHEVDENSFKVYNVKDAALNDIGFDEYTRLRNTLKKNKERKLINQGEFLAAADRNARKVLKELLESSDATKEYTYIFETKHTSTEANSAKTETEGEK